MLCRLCLIDSTEVLDIFEGDGEQLNIANVIGQHFWFVPIKDDQISNICCTCWLKVDEFHQFYCFIKDAQKKLSEILLTDQKSTQQTSRTYLKKEKNDDDEDEWIYDTAVNEYVNVIRDNIVNDDIKIKSEHCDNDELRHDKFEEVKDPIYTDNTNQSNKIHSEINEKTCDNHKSNAPSKNKLNLKTNARKKRGRPKKQTSNISDSEEDLPLKHFVVKKQKRDKNEKSEYVKNSKEKDDIIAKYMKLKCELCCEEFKSFGQIRQHYRTKHNAKGYVVCCNNKFYKRILLFDHINKHLNPEYFKCGKCNKIYSSKNCLKNHMLTHKSECSKTFECELCSKKFVNNFLLRRHKFIHVPLEERQFLCDDCGKAFPTKYLLQTHRRYVHQNAYGKMCHICAKVIIGKSMFEKHQLEHAGIVEPKVQCKKCGAWLKHKYGLRKHMKLHIESSIIHKCDICGKISPTKGALRSHKSYVHEAKRSYQCGICDKAFKVAMTLKEHMTTHTGEVLYTCPHCPKTFNSSANLHAHRKKKHRKEWEESRKDRGVSAIAIKSNTTFEDDKNNSKECKMKDDSYKLSETEINVDNTLNEQNLISLVLDSMQTKN